MQLANQGANWLIRLTWKMATEMVYVIHNNCRKILGTSSGSSSVW